MTLQLQNVSVDLAGQPVLRQVNYQPEKGALNVIVGPNGSGKSTLLKVLSAEVSPTYGSALLNGADVSKMSALSLAQQRAVLSQRPELAFDFTVAEIVELGALPHVQAGRSNIADQRNQIISKLALGPLLQRRFSCLSGGQQQRVQLARVLLQGLLAQNPILLLDEPVAALDVAWQQKALSLLASLSAEVCIVLVLHELNLASQYAGHISMLKNGQIVFAGAASAVLSAANLEHVFDHPFAVVAHNQHSLITPL